MGCGGHAGANVRVLTPWQEDHRVPSCSIHPWAAGVGPAAGASCDYLMAHSSMPCAASATPGPLATYEVLCSSCAHTLPLAKVWCTSMPAGAGGAAQQRVAALPGAGAPDVPQAVTGAAPGDHLLTGACVVPPSLDCTAPAVAGLQCDDSVEPGTAWGLKGLQAYRLACLAASSLAGAQFPWSSCPVSSVAYARSPANWQQACPPSLTVVLQALR